MLKSVSPFTICAAAAGAVVLIVSGSYLKAQEPQPEQFPALNSTRSSVLQALTDRLPYVPGDILVKFRDGSGMVARTRALSVMRTGARRAGSRVCGRGRCLPIRRTSPTRRRWR